MNAGDPREELARSPFRVLGVPVTATRAEVEREGQRLLDALELGLPGADRYDTPLGVRPRGAQEVREALAELRDPERRALHEVFAASPAASSSVAAPDAPSAAAPWPDAFAALGWGPR